jgi:hypothetical protein
VTTGYPFTLIMEFIMLLIFKLISGEEILGDLEEESILSANATIRIINPVGISYVQGQDGRPNIGFVPFPLYAPKTKNMVFDIDKDKVVYSYVPAEDFVNNYNQLFGSGIVVPQKQIITG